MKLNRSSHTQQKGVALITVLVVVALMSLIVTQISSGHILNSRRTQNTIFTDQAFLYVLSAEELAGQMLSEFYKANKGKPMKLNDPWAEPFMFPLDNGMIQGQLRDAQACFNLNSVTNNVWHEDKNNNGSKDGNLEQNNSNDPRIWSRKPVAGQKLLEKLIELVTEQNMDILMQNSVSAKDLAQAVRDWLDEDDTVSGAFDAEDYYYTGLPIGHRTANQKFASKTELRLVRGFTKPIYDLISPYVCVIPGEESGRININTIDSSQPELLRMIYQDMSAAQAQEILNNPIRTEQGYDSTSFNAQLGSIKENKFAKDRITFESSYFFLEANAQLDGRYANIYAILSRRNDQFKVLHRHFGEQ